MKKEPKKKVAPKKNEQQKKESKIITNVDIAREAGVSKALVSAFLSGKYYGPDRKQGIGISEATREHIRETCFRLNYIPDNPAGFFCLYPEKADVAFLLNDIVYDGFSNPYHSLIFEGFTKAATEKNVDLSNFLFRSQHDYMLDPDPLPNAILRGSIKKIALNGNPPNYSLLLRLQQMDVAVVVMGMNPELDGIVAVVPDFFEAGRMGIHKLYDNGHRDIMVIRSEHTTKNRYSGKKLEDGCFTALRELGLNCNENALLEFTSAEGRDEHLTGKRFLSLESKPTGVFCLDDQITRTLIRGLSEHGLSIPDDLSVIGCNDDRYNRDLRPWHSSIHVPCCRMGSRAFQELNRIAAQGRPERSETIILPVHFVDKGTVKSLTPVTS